jgi:hypothetical protein
MSNLWRWFVDRYRWLAEKPGRALQLVVLLRFQLLVAAVLVFFAPVVLFSGQGIRNLLGNLYSTDPLGLIFVSLWSVFVAWAIIITTRITFRNIGARLEKDDFALRAPVRMDPTNTRPFWWGLMALPMIGSAVAESEGSLIWRMAGVVGGVLVAVALLRLGQWLTARAIGPDDAALLNLAGQSAPKGVPEPAQRVLLVSWLFRIMDWVFSREPFDHGYINRETGRVMVGHRLAVVMGGLAFALYMVICVVFMPVWAHSHLHPALGYVLVVLLVAAWFLPGAAFFLDRWRVPVVLSLIPYLLIVYVVSKADHFFVVTPAPTENMAQLCPDDTLNHWLDWNGPDTDAPLIVVATTGGGITSAAWTAQVLTRLEQEFGDSFVRSLHAVSSVSGGSVGVMNYLSGFSRREGRPDDQLEMIRAAAEAPSLPAVAWGVAYPDLMRIAAPYVMNVVWKYDRAWAMEQSWRHHLVADTLADTLHGWRARVADGQLPVVLFNSTIADTGDRFVITPTDMAGYPNLCDANCRSFLETFDYQDLSIVTAVRLSATFPWVTPMARRQQDGAGPEYHFADGGYFENFGVETLLEWMGVVLPRYLDLGGRRVLVIRIEDAPPDELDPEEIAEPQGSLYSSIGPVKTLLEARTATQRFRIHKAIREFEHRWAEHCSNAGCFDENDLEIVTFTLECENAPLSWQLDADQLQCIEDGWAKELTEDDWKRVVEFLGE